ncbi:glycoside hydrolase family 18 protein [Armillaria fumosa]|nr:glycoside hydrolase family 18 protein [Armillaria fumosa]
MSSIASVFIDKHTTSSTPDLHILYAVEVGLDDGTKYEVLRRYSEFAALHDALGDPYSLPPKNSVFNAIIPSAWVDDELIAERKDGLLAYLNSLLRSSRYQASSKLLAFLNPNYMTDVHGLDDEITPSMICKVNLTIKAPVSRLSSPVAAAYYPDWSSWSNPPGKLDFSKFDILFFAFVVPNSSSTINWDDGSQDTLRDLVSAAHQSGHGTQIVLSIGGWGGSYWFSNSMSNATNRTKLVNALVGAVNSFGLDGIDIDWEYPNSPGSGNPYSWADAANFLTFLKSLRAALGWSKIISAAVAHHPWLGPNGAPLSNVSDYAAQMSYINIMNYDVNGASANPGPNAPLGNPCGSSSQPEANAQAALSQWQKAGFPASKMLLGLALYGYVSKSTATRLSNSYVPATDPHEHAPLVEHVDAVAGDLSQWWGSQVAFKQLVSAGALKKQADGSYNGANGFTKGWDGCSDTPFLFNTAKTTVVSYDDTDSLADKAKFAKQSGMAGCFTWSLDQDDGYSLQNIVLSNLGK